MLNKNKKVGMWLDLFIIPEIERNDELLIYFYFGMLFFAYLKVFSYHASDTEVLSAFLTWHSAELGHLE